MKTIVAFPSTAVFAQQAALAFAERGSLAAYLTTFAWDENTRAARALRLLPPRLRERVTRELRRRDVMLPKRLLETHPFWEIVRTAAVKIGFGPTVVDRIWDHLSYQFTQTVAGRMGPGIGGLYAYEYTALEAFEAAQARGVARILDFPSLNSRQFEELRRSERSKFPELRQVHDPYFDARFGRRQARRDRELALADVVITNSSLTRQSHILGGANPDRTFAVPYGAPQPVSAVEAGRSLNGPLHVVWAGTFSVRKGAHLFVEAWRNSGFGADATADVYGAIEVPAAMFMPLPKGINFHGSVVRERLFEAFAKADVLVFPTLSDGFGMVVTEAFARGLPVITTDQAGASDLVRHGENGLIIPAGDSRPIAEALGWCLQHRERLMVMRQAALDTAKGWQWPQYRDALINAVSTGLRRAGYEPGFGAMAPVGLDAATSNG